MTTYDQLIEKGRKETAVSVAEKLLSEGMSVEKVAELTELPIEQVREIAEGQSED